MVEDSATDAELALRAFARAKIANRLRVVSSGEEALDYLFGTGIWAKRGATRPLLILLDLQLPRMSGVEFLRQIKGDERTCDIPVVSLSFTKNPFTIVKCLQLGVDDHVVKPVDFKTLIGVVKKLKLRLTMAPPDAAPGGPVLAGGKAH